MIHIDEKFKECPPEQTVENIRRILASVGIEVEENSRESGLESCYTARVTAKGGLPGANGKGVSPSLAKASAYGEFIERLQIGLFLGKYPGLEAARGMNLYDYAPDAKYMSKAELVECGEWMDYIIAEHKELPLTRESIAEMCVLYDGNENVMTVPYYSLFEKKHVYLPVAFIKTVYSTNGCCAGNTRDEAWVHAMSEILERHACIKMITTGEAAPVIPDEVLKQFDTVYSMIKKLRAMELDVSVLDFSDGIDFPVIATRILNKKTGGYHVHVGADPIFEIAVKRSFTESFQGRSIASFHAEEITNVLTKVTDINSRHNVLNQLEIGGGAFTIDFFSEELKCKREFKPFTDNSAKSNKELLKDILGIYKALGKPLYVRNFSFLGFPSYFFVVPGFSEAQLAGPHDAAAEHFFANNAAKALRYIEKADDASLEELLLSQLMASTAKTRAYSFKYRSGIPLTNNEQMFTVFIHLAYASYKLNKTRELCNYLTMAARSIEDNQKIAGYVRLLSRYFKLKAEKVSSEQIDIILKRFHTSEAYLHFCEVRESNTYLDEFLVRCDFESCNSCPLKNCCQVQSIRSIIKNTGEKFASFKDGQNEENFKLDFEI